MLKQVFLASVMMKR